MTPETLNTFLAQAGLDAGAVGAAERLLLPAPQIDEARTAPPSAAFARPGLLNVGLLQVRSDVLGAAGLVAGFDEDARTLVLSAPEDLSFTVTPADDSGVVGMTTVDDSGVVAKPVTFAAVPVRQASAFVLACAAGPLAIVSFDPRAIGVRAVHAWPAPPVWDAANDSGVVRVEDSGVDGAPRWGATVAAGRLARRIEPGASEAASIAARRWLRGLTANQRALIERFAIAQARDIAAHLSRIQDGQGLDASLDFAWQALCWGRDDVEGVRVLLREAGTGDALAAVLRSVDTTGRAVRFSWPSEVDVHDARLQIVSEADPGAWWGSTRRQVVWL